MKNDSIRVRFAPSPTGPLHIGGVRTALYNYLFARSFGGQMILRIEDTDQNRFVAGAEEYIVESLAWCGIVFDEGPVTGGPHAPYRQSERSELYRREVARLVEAGHAYFAFDSENDLTSLRQQAEVEKRVFQYDQKTRKSLRNSLTLPPAETEFLLKSGVPYVIRIKIPENEHVTVKDLIRGEVTVNTENLDDKVLFKSDGLPTYHLANVVDDYTMKITHVIRGEEWLPSAPLHVLLYRFFGWEQVMPSFAHLPLILKPDGNGKLSKRDGDRLGFPVFPLNWPDPASGEVFSGYRENGYLPEAVINILAHLGWNPGTDQELFSMEELIQQFSLERVGRHGSKFDPEKARWFNHQYIQKLEDTEIIRLLRPQLFHHQVDCSDAFLLSVFFVVRERMFLLGDFWQHSWFFFKQPETYDPQVRQKVWNPEVGTHVRHFSEELSLKASFSKDSFHDLATEFAVRQGIKTGQLMNPLRLLVVGSNQGPGMADIASILGKEEFLNRIVTGLSRMETLL